ALDRTAETVLRDLDSRVTGRANQSGHRFLVGGKLLRADDSSKGKGSGRLSPQFAHLAGVVASPVVVVFSVPRIFRLFRRVVVHRSEGKIGRASCRELGGNE